jgi:amino acid adenylation domain-containing protein
MSLLQDFFSQYQQHPNQIAFCEGSRHITYADLAEHIKSQSGFFRAGQRIAIFMERGMDAACAILSILYAGACYIPLDNKNPAARLNQIIDDAQPDAVIGLTTRPDWLATSVTWINLTNKPDQPGLSAKSNPEAIAAILYTSGSTGRPKGVALSYRALANFSDWAAETFAITSTDRIASLAPFHFDLSLFDLFSSLQRGAQVFFIPANLSLAPSRLSQWLTDQSITAWYTVPSLLSFLALKGNLSQTPLPDLRCVLFAGEVFPTPTLKKLTALLPNTDFYNLYGPTETNVCCYWPVDRNRLKENQAIPIGKAAAGAILKIDPDNQELLVKSDNNFSGYWRQGTLQAVKLREGYYPTGDRVSLNERGEYCYHGRLDRMLKCSGFRVEPAEIEAAICQHPAVSRCAVVGLYDPTAGQRPAAAIVLTQKVPLSEIMQALRQQLPAYMIPGQVNVLDQLPFLSNGKIDYLSVTNLFHSS